MIYRNGESILRITTDFLAHYVRVKRTWFAMSTSFLGFGKRPHVFYKSLLVVIIAVTFCPVLWNSFVSWDDNENYRQNDIIKGGLSAKSILWILSDGTLLGVYEPTATLVKLLIVSGSKFVVDTGSEDPLSPQPIIAFSLCLHCVNSLMVFDFCPGSALSLTLCILCQTQIFLFGLLNLLPQLSHLHYSLTLAFAQLYYIQSRSSNHLILKCISIPNGFSMQFHAET